MAQVDDLSRSLEPFEQDGTLVAVLEMSQASWLTTASRVMNSGLRKSEERCCESAPICRVNSGCAFRLHGAES